MQTYRTVLQKQGRMALVNQCPAELETQVCEGHDAWFDGVYALHKKALQHLVLSLQLLTLLSVLYTVCFALKVQQCLELSLYAHAPHPGTLNATSPHGQSPSGDGHGNVTANVTAADPHLEVPRRLVLPETCVVRCPTTCPASFATLLLPSLVGFGSFGGGLGSQLGVWWGLEVAALNQLILRSSRKTA